MKIIKYYGCPISTFNFTKKKHRETATQKFVKIRRFCIIVRLGSTFYTTSLMNLQIHENILSKVFDRKITFEGKFFDYFVG